ncbi:MAG: tRNA 2-thiouridine(34) synthase MnmA [Alphaproteobacteria bacterium]|jgi:tRNA-specific 2-thiouridylase|nr:tRNA 2-thiouridine(34) synthase MnmA [Alphaproteobacteria bacterium]MBP9877427.1 tRNA 2-thiouridine(34) synthase MnmA [Alphaproteobacteria bacterium]
MKNSLGFLKPPSETRVVVAMSGGVDSSTVAALLADEGYEVIGVTLQLYDYGDALRKKGACCAGIDIYDARDVADKIGIKHYVLDYESRFSNDVMTDFADSYLKGETPIPCVRCNQKVKFKDMLEMARDLGADCLATGHYVQRFENDEGRGQLFRGADPQKDQSYFLFTTTQDQLDYLRFPIGGLTKDKTRALAEKYGLSVADKPDSQDICFVPNGNYASIVQKLRPEAIVPGDIYHVDGRLLGKHEGIIHFTIGQRKGIGIGGIKGESKDAEPLFVVKLEPETHRVIVGPKEALLRKKVFVHELNWIGDPLLLTQANEFGASADLPVAVKIRSIQEPLPARVTIYPDQRAVIVLDAELSGISPGQAAVIYDGDRVLGGGFISKTE